jgi:hypothetical protein
LLDELCESLLCGQTWKEALCGLIAGLSLAIVGCLAPGADAKITLEILIQELGVFTGSVWAGNICTQAF